MPGILGNFGGNSMPPFPQGMVQAQGRNVAALPANPGSMFGGSTGPSGIGGGQGGPPWLMGSGPQGIPSSSWLPRPQPPQATQGPQGASGAPWAQQGGMFPGQGGGIPWMQQGMGGGIPAQFPGAGQGQGWQNMPQIAQNAMPSWAGGGAAPTMLQNIMGGNSPWTGGMRPPLGVWGLT